jgi:putative ABC transport system permease protein
MVADFFGIGSRMNRIVVSWIGTAELRAHPGRALLAALAIAIGVGLGFAVHLVNASALNEFSRAVQAVNGDADLQVHSVTPRGFNENLYPKLARVAGISDASPVVEIAAHSGREPLTLLGIDIFRAAYVTPALLGRPAASATGGDNFASTGSLSPDSIFLPASALTALHKHVGDAIEIDAGGKTAVLHIAGTLPGVTTGDDDIAVLDIATAQWRFGMPGLIQRVDLRLSDGADGGRVRAAVQSALSPDAEIVTRESEESRIGSLSRAYRINLEMLALMALLTGAFLAYSAQALAVARRHAEFALLRVLGMRRRAVLAEVLIEGGAIGIAGGIGGVLLGWALAAAALRLLGGDLGGGYFSGTRPELVFDEVASGFFFMLGLLCAVAGSLLPALDAARAAPAIAIKQAGDPADPKKSPGMIVPVILLAIGAAVAFLPPVGDLPLFGYISIGLLLAGGIAAMPLIARLMLSPFRRFSFPASIDLALKHLWGAPGQAAIALCGMVASTSLMIAMAVMIWSFRNSVDAWLVQVLPSDIYVRVDSDDGDALTPDIQQRLTQIPGVVQIHFRKNTPLRLAPERPPIDWMATAVKDRNPVGILPMIGKILPAPAGAIPVWVSEPAHWIYGYTPGQWIRLPIGDRNGRRFFIAGEWRDYGRQQGAIAMSLADYTALTGDETRTDAAIDVARGTDEHRVMDEVRTVLPPEVARNVTIADSRTIRALSLHIFDRSFAVTYLLEGIAILVGLAGIAATFSSQTLARSKEFGMLRHVGVLRRQILAMLAMEGAMLGVVGVVAGMVLGLAISQILIQVINPQSFHWTMDVRLPGTLFISVAVAMIAASAGTALIAGRKALSRDSVLAVREDW